MPTTAVLWKQRNNLKREAMQKHDTLGSRRVRVQRGGRAGTKFPHMHTIWRLRLADAMGTRGRMPTLELCIQHTMLPAAPRPACLGPPDVVTSPRKNQGMGRATRTEM